MENIAIRQPDPEPYVRAGSEMVENARAAVIESNDDRELAGTVVAELDRKIKLIEYEFDGTDADPGPTKAAHMAWKKMVALRDKALFGFVEAKKLWNGQIRLFEFNIEQKRKEEARKAEAVALQKAEEARKKEIAEAKRIGDKEGAAQLKQAPLIVNAAPPKTPEVTKADGLRRSSPIWRWRLANESKVPAEFRCLDEKKIDQWVRSQGAKANIPGIIVYDARGEGA